MGIKDLNKVIKKVDSSIYKTDSIQIFTGKKVAVDLSIFINSFALTSQENWINLLVNFMMTLVKHGLDPIMVIDGPNVPIEKLDERESRKNSQQANKSREERLAHLKERIMISCFDGETTRLVPESLQEDIKKACRTIERDEVNVNDADDVLLYVTKKLGKAEQAAAGITKHHKETARLLVKSMGLKYIQADGEAETLAASMAYHGMVDAVVSRDTDCLVYGCPILITDIKGDKVSYVVYKDILRTLEMKRKQFIDMCIALGCDYNIRMKGQGLVACFKSMKEYGSIEEWKKAKPELPFHVLKWKRCRELFRVYSRKYLEEKCPVTRRNESVETLDKIFTEANSNYTGQYVIDCLHGKATARFMPRKTECLLEDMSE